MHYTSMEALLTWQVKISLISGPCYTIKHQNNFFFNFLIDFYIHYIIQTAYFVHFIIHKVYDRTHFIQLAKCNKIRVQSRCSNQQNTFMRIDSY